MMEGGASIDKIGGSMGIQAPVCRLRSLAITEGAGAFRPLRLLTNPRF